MKYNHVQQRNGRFIWRLNICGEALRNIDENDREQSYTVPSSAAYACDLGKFFIREKFGVRSSKTELSLTPEAFAEKAQQEGLDLTDLNAVFEAMPWRIQEFIRDAGPFLEQQGKRDAARAAVSVNSDYLQTLLLAYPKRLIDLLSLVQKTRQMNGLDAELSATLADYEFKLTEFENLTRGQFSRFLK